MAGPVRISIIARARDAIRAFRQTGDAAERMGRRVKDSNRDISVFSTVAKVAASRAALIGAGAAIALPGLLKVLAALAPLMGLLVALPAAIGAVAVISGTLAIALNGVGDAMSAGLTGDTEAYNKALKKLSPSAQSAVKAVVALKKPFEDIKKSTQQALFKPLVDQIKPLASTYLPIAKTGFTNVAGALGRMGKAFAQAARSSEMVQGVKDLFKGVADGIDAASVAVKPLTKAFGILLSAGAPVLKQLGTYLGDLGTRFATFITGASKTGQLTSWLQGGIDTLKTLGTIVKNTFSVFASLLGAANNGGNNLLTTLAGWTEKLAAFLKTAEGQRVLKEIFSTIGNAVSAIGDLVKALAPVAGILLRVAVAALKLATWLVEKLAAGLQAVNPYILKFGDYLDGLKIPQLDIGPFKGIIDTVKGLATSSEFTSIFTKVAAGAKSLVEPIKNFINTVKPIITEVVQTISDKFAELAPKIRPIFTDIATIVTEAFTIVRTIITTVTAAIQTAWSLFGENIKNTISSTMGVVVSILSGAVGIIKGIFQIFSGLLTGDWSKAWDGVKSVVSGVVGVVTGVVNGMLTVVKFVMTAIGTVVGVAWNAVKAKTSDAWNAAKSFVSTAIGGLRSAVSSGVNSAKSAVSSAWNAVKSATSSAWNAVKSAVSSAVGGLISTVSGITGRIRGAVGSWGGILSGAGRDLVQGAINGIQGMAGAIAGAARSVAQAATNAFKSALHIGSPSRVFAALGRWVGLGFIQGLTGTESRITSTLKTLANKVANTFGGRTERNLLRSIGSTNTKLTRLARARNTVGDQIVAANKRIVDLKKARADVVNNVRDSIQGSFKIVQDGATSLRAILVGSAKAVKDATTFASNLAVLKKAGLNASQLQELANAGPAAAGNTVRALLKATPAQLKQLNADYAKLGKTGTKLGDTIGGALFDSGIRAAQGLITGLTRQKSNIEKTMLDIAKGMQKAIRKALGIHSPSTKLMRLGEDSIRGFAQGFESISGKSMANNLARGLSTVSPAFKAASFGSASAGATTEITVNVYTGAVVDKRGLVETITDAFNEVTADMGRPMKLNVVTP